MVIKEFGAINFRNFRECFITLSERINLFIGGNGAGKTNLAEGLYYLCHLSSFRTQRNDQLLTFGEERGYLQGTVIKFDSTEFQTPVKARAELTRQGRRVWLEDRAVPKLSAYIVLFHSLLFNPDSLYNYRHFPAERRASFDRFLSFYDREYMEANRDFRKVFLQKNHLLKNGEISSLPDWNQLFIEKGHVIIKKRRELTEKLNVHLADLHHRLAGDRAVKSGRLILEYKPSLTGDPREDALTLEKARESEMKAGHALHGPHRDDFRMAQAGRREEFFSQGEYRIALLAMKMAMNELLAEEKQLRPILILDDLYSELDRTVSGKLSEYLHTIPNQVFITTTQSPGEIGFPGERIMEIRDGRIV